MSQISKNGGTTNPTADVALCTLLSTEDGIPKVWKSNGWDKQVFGERTVSQMSVGDYVEITGKTSGENSDAQIQDLSYNIDAGDYPYTNGLNDLVLVDPDWLPDDSGTPVYIKYPDQQAQIYMIYACGIVSGGIYINDVLTWCVYSSVENIETKLGFDSDFITDH